MKRSLTLMALVAAIMIQSTAATASDLVYARLHTNMGFIDIEMHRDKAPMTVRNFIRYAKAGRYNDTIFHRVMKGFMIQGGGFNQNIEKVSTFTPVANESDNGLPNNIGTIAMARTSSPHSATNQFFINTANNHMLNFETKPSRKWGYTVFGRIIRGMDVVRKIESISTGGWKDMKNVPIRPVIIQSVELKE